MKNREVILSDLFRWFANACLIQFCPLAGCYDAVEVSSDITPFPKYHCWPFFSVHFLVPLLLAVRVDRTTGCDEYSSLWNRLET
jgi:hypothetical protein